MMSGTGTGWDIYLVRSLLHVSSLLFVLAAAAAANPDTAPETGTPPVAATPPAAAPPPSSDGPKELQLPPSGETKPKAKISPTEIRQLRDTHFKQCMRDWDAGTHMTKKDSERTCRRVVETRVKFLTEQTGK